MRAGQRTTDRVAGACRTVGIWVGICSLGLLLSGCPIGGIIGVIVKEPETVKVPAEYRLPAGNLLILVDTQAGMDQIGVVPLTLSRELLREIAFHDLAPEVIGPRELSVFRSNTENFNELDIAQIGRKLSAQQVLYIQVLEFRLGTLVDNPPGRGVIRARVKVFDVKENRRVWPETEPLGREVAVRTGFREPVGKNYQQDFIEDLCGKMAVRIVKLFREHREPRRKGPSPIESI